MMFFADSAFFYDLALSGFNPRLQASGLVSCREFGRFVSACKIVAGEFADYQGALLEIVRGARICRSATVPTSQ